MLDKDVKEGMKVVPHDQTLDYLISDFGRSIWSKRGEQKYLYVSMSNLFYEGKPYYLLNIDTTHPFNSHMHGFRSADFEPYYENPAMIMEID